MLILADENFPLPTVEAMRADDHNVLWAWTNCPGHADTGLFERVEAESWLVLTLDKDFWQIAPQRREPLERAGVILFRVRPAVPDNITPMVQRVSIVMVDGIQMIPARGRGPR